MTVFALECSQRPSCQVPKGMAPRSSAVGGASSKGYCKGAPLPVAQVQTAIIIQMGWGPS